MFLGKTVLDVSTLFEVVNRKECHWSGLLFHQSIRCFCSTVCSFNLVLPLVCLVKYRLNARAAEILAQTVDSCFETTNMMYATSGEVGVEKYGGKAQFLF